MSSRKMATVILVIALLTPSLSFVAACGPAGGPDTPFSLPSPSPPPPPLSHSLSAPAPSHAGSRAQAEALVDTDWSGGRYNTSSGIEVEMTPGDMVLESDIGNMVEVLSPSALDGIYSMVEYDGDLFIAAASPGTGTDTTEIFRCSLTNATCQKVLELEEDVVYEMTVPENGSRLFIPGGLSTNASNDGGLYIFNGTGVQRSDVTGLTTTSVGLRAAVEMGNKLFVSSIDDDDRAYIYRSVDDGNTWHTVFSLTPAAPNRRAMNSMTLSGDNVFAQPDGIGSEGATIYKYNGTIWRPEDIPGITGDYGAFVASGGEDYFLSAGNLFVYDDGEWSQVVAPFSPTVLEAEAVNTTTGNATTLGPIAVGRTGHTADLAPATGMVVVAGGIIGDHLVATTEIVEASSGNITLGDDLMEARAYHASVVLQSGQVLVIGGIKGGPPAYSATQSVERYDPAGDSWNMASSMSAARFNHTATVLNDGKVLVVGGSPSNGNHLSSVEVFDPSGGGWSAAAPMGGARSNHVAVLMNNGSVFVAGGRDGTGALSTAEVYVPGTGTWYPLPDMPFAAYDLAATVLSNGNVLVSGGTTTGLAGLRSTAVLDTTTDTWSAVGDMAAGRLLHTLTTTGSGPVLAIGGLTDHSTSTMAGCEVYSGGSWSAAQTVLAEARFSHAAVEVDPTTILVIGGARPSVLGPRLFKAAAPFGGGGIVIGSTDGTVHTHTHDGWTSGGPVAGGLDILDVGVFHGRVHASTAGGAKVFVAGAGSSGSLVSDVMSFSGHLENGSLDWDAAVPTGTGIRLQVKSAREASGIATADFVGPDGTNSTYFTVPGTALSDVHIGHRFFQYHIELSSTDPVFTPVVTAVTIDALTTPLILTVIEVTPATATITADEWVDFDVIGYDQFGMEMSFIAAWSASGGNINPTTGNYTPTTSGTWTVHASAFTVEGTAEVTVLPGALTAVEVSPPTWVGSTDDFKVFVATGYDAKGNIVPFTPQWTTTGGGPISQDGNFTPNSPGSWIIYANDTGTGLGGSAVATVWSGAPSRISIDPKQVTMEAGEYLLFISEVTDADGNILDVPVEWSITGGGAINMFGNLSATVVGVWTVHANMSSFALSASATVTVTPGDLNRIIVSPDVLEMDAGATEILTATPMDAYGNTLDMQVSWTATGGQQISGSGAFSPLRSGTWKVYANISGVSGEALVRVTPGPLHRILLTPENVTLTFGNGTSFRAVAEDEYGNAIPTTILKWALTGGLGNIDNNGNFIAGTKAMTGEVTVEGTYKNSTVSASATIVVEAPKGPQEEPPDPYYYFMIGIVIFFMIIGVSLLLMVELSRQ